MIPRFPEFKVIDEFDKLEIFNLTIEYPPYSDFNFTSLLSWNTNNTTYISTLYKNLIIKMNDYITHEDIICFLGKRNTLKTFNAILKYIKSTGGNEILQLVPESCIPFISNKHFIIQEDKNNFDYIYSIDALSKCSGRKYETMRNQINRFKKNYGENFSIKIINLADRKEQIEILSLVKKWNDKKNSKNDTEYKAIQNFIKYADLSAVINIGIYVDKKLIAFCFSEKIRNQYILSHFAKADISYTGIYSLLINETAKILHSMNYTLLNYEQDLGIESLRHAKMQMRPIMFLKKYSIKPILEIEANEFLQLHFPQLIYENKY